MKKADSGVAIRVTLCSKCKDEPRVKGSGWGRRCIKEKMRKNRTRSAAFVNKDVNADVNAVNKTGDSSATKALESQRACTSPLGHAPLRMGTCQHCGAVRL